MKPLRPQFAFTLVELLTVIAIIAVLMGLLFPAIGGAKDNARRAEAGTMVRNIVNASKSYFNDYGKYPPIPDALVEKKSSGGADSSGGDESYYAFGDVELSAGKVKVSNSEIFDVLRGIPRGKNKDNLLNPRQQKYFEGKKAADVGLRKTRGGFADGQEFQERQGRLFDPWGAEFFVVLDADGNEELDMGDLYTDLNAASDAGAKLRFSAVSFCIGKDGKFGGKGYETFRKAGAPNEAPDDIVSWQ